MRRLLSEADERATSKTRVLQDRLEEAEKERDKFEHEMLSSSRRTNRQLEELKQRVRDLERESKTLAEDKEALEGKEREWRRRREELEVSYFVLRRARLRHYPGVCGLTLIGKPWCLSNTNTLHRPSSPAMMLKWPRCALLSATCAQLLMHPSNKSVRPRKLRMTCDVH